MEQRKSRVKAANIRMNAHEKIFSVALEHCDHSHIIAEPGERKSKPKCKIIISVFSSGRAEELKNKINDIIKETQELLRAESLPDNFEYNIKIARALSEDIRLTGTQAYKQTKHTGTQLYNKCLNVFEQIAVHYPARAETTEKAKDKFIKQYNESIRERILNNENYYIIQDTGTKYRITYYGEDEEETAPHRMQSSVGDIFILSGIHNLQIRSNTQKTRSDKTAPSDYIYCSEYFSIKPQKRKTT